MADITSPPKKPIRQIRRPNKAAWAWVKGVIGASSAASAVAEVMPPTVPDTVFEGESAGMIFGPPISLPQMYCSTSEACTTAIRNIGSRMLFSLLKPSKCRNISAGTCERQKMQIIAIHCVLAARARKSSVWPLRPVMMGSSRKPYIGMKMANRPYHSRHTSQYCTGSST